jgi:lantibiotic biosynthesis protein
MSHNDLLPHALASKADEVATAILYRLSDKALVIEAAQNASQTMGGPIWEPGASLYAGAAGSALAFAYAARVCPSSSDHWWAQAQDWLKLVADRTRDDPVPYASLSRGTAGVAFAVAGCDPDGRYLRTLRRLHVGLAEQLDLYVTTDDRGLAFDDYDVINGPAGILGHLIRHSDDPTAQRTAVEIVERLVAACGTADPRRGDADTLPGHRERDGGPLYAPDWTLWRIPVKNYPMREENELYPYGYVDLGLAHGIPGPLAALSRAWLAGYRIPGLREAIRALTDLIVAAYRHGGSGRDWPRVLPFDESGEVVPDMSHPSDPFYCYGSPGVASALLDAATALDDAAVRTIAVEGFEAALRLWQPGGTLGAPGLCHGEAGMVLICHRFATQTGSVAARAALVPLVDGLLGRCDPRLCLFVQDYKPPAAGMPGSPLANGTDGAWIDSPGLLEGSTGVALTLLSVATPLPPRWARALLVD